MKPKVLGFAAAGIAALSTTVLADGKNEISAPWPDSLRQKIENQIEGNFGVK